MVDICGSYELPKNLQSVMQKDLTEVKLGDSVFHTNNCIPKHGYKSRSQTQRINMFLYSHIQVCPSVWTCDT